MASFEHTFEPNEIQRFTIDGIGFVLKSYTRSMCVLRMDNPELAEQFVLRGHQMAENIGKEMHFDKYGKVLFRYTAHYVLLYNGIEVMSFHAPPRHLHCRALLGGGQVELL